MNETRKDYAIILAIVCRIPENNVQAVTDALAQSEATIIYVKRGPVGKRLKIVEEI
jgi:hypothetical protein